MKALTIGGAALIAFASLSNWGEADNAPLPEEGAVTVQALHQLCTGDELPRLICIGYVGGVGDQMFLVGEARDRYADQAGRQLVFAFSLCNKPTWGAMIQAFKNWAEKHPERWSYPGAWGVTHALQETWPCAK